MSLEQQFQTAAEDVKKVTNRPSDQELLDLYGLYKQATAGDNETAQPWAVQLEARAKWDSWAKHKGTSKEDAMKKYIELANQVKAKYN